MMTGSLGADQFAVPCHQGKRRDSIVDFSAGEDKVDLSGAGNFVANAVTRARDVSGGTVLSLGSNRMLTIKGMVGSNNIWLV